MAVYLCHAQPDLYEHSAPWSSRAPGRVVLDRSAFHPGGGGQVSDVGSIEHAGGVVGVTGIETVDDVVWHVLDTDVALAGDVVVASTPSTAPGSPSCTPTAMS